MVIPNSAKLGILNRTLDLTSGVFYAELVTVAINNPLIARSGEIVRATGGNYTPKILPTPSLVLRAGEVAIEFKSCTWEALQISGGYTIKGITYLKRLQNSFSLLDPIITFNPFSAPHTPQGRSLIVRSGGFSLRSDGGDTNTPDPLMGIGMVFRSALVGLLNRTLDLTEGVFHAHAVLDAPTDPDLVSSLADLELLSGGNYSPCAIQNPTFETSNRAALWRSLNPVWTGLSVPGLQKTIKGIVISKTMGTQPAPDDPVIAYKPLKVSQYPLGFTPNGSTFTAQIGLDQGIIRLAASGDSPSGGGETGGGETGGGETGGGETGGGETGGGETGGGETGGGETGGGETGGGETGGGETGGGTELPPGRLIMPAPPADPTRWPWINLDEVVNYSSSIPTTDIWKLAGGVWYHTLTSGGWNNAGPLDLDSDGWVRSLGVGRKATAGMFVDNPVYPAGQYTLLYDGTGIIRPDLGTGSIVSSQPGRLVLNIPAGNKIYVSIFETNPSDYIRNIRLILPGYEDTYQQVFWNPDWINQIGRFGGWRFMNWGRINDSRVVTWADRCSPSFWSPDRRGVPLEWMIKLCNDTGRPGWFYIPHAADNEYVENMALMLREQHDPSIKIRIALSNEVWNGQFRQAKHFENLATSLGIPGSSAFERQLRAASQRSVECFQIFNRVFEGRQDQIIPVMEGQAANTYVISTMLNWNNAFRFVKEAAIAPYVNPSYFVRAVNAEAIAAMTPDQILDALKQEIRTVVRTRIANHVNRLASYPGLVLTMYEGNQHLYTNTMPAALKPQITALFLQVVRSPRWKNLYREYLELWRELASPGMFCHYKIFARPTEFGFWGAKEGQNQNSETAPMYMAMQEFMDNTPWTPEP